VRRKLDPVKLGFGPLDKNIFSLSKAELEGIQSVPGSLGEALDHLEKDHQFLLEGGVFSEDLIQTWIDYKRTNEVAAVNLRPHPMEFELYFNQ